MGILYIVPTPVGNMEDMTLRAIRILKEADLVLAEDTRTSGILLKHFQIQQHLMSHHKFNEHGTSAAIVERLQAGQTIALVSDAGTPGISVQVLRFRHCQVQSLSCQPWCPVDFPVTVSASRASFLRRKVASRR